jgi:microcystin-dependent protein
MGERAYLGEIRFWAADYAPEGWHFCDGSLLDQDKYPNLHEIIGAIYGGNGSLFALPDLRGVVPVGAVDESDDRSAGSAVSTCRTGQTGGGETNPLPHELAIPLARHTHEVTFTPTEPIPHTSARIAVGSGLATTNIPQGNVLAKPRKGGEDTLAYSATPTNDYYLGGVSGGGGRRHRQRQGDRRSSRP